MGEARRADLRADAAFTRPEIYEYLEQEGIRCAIRLPAKQWVKEGKYALYWTRLSCHRFVANQVRLALFVLAYNRGNFVRRLALPDGVRHWSLRSIQVKLIKIRAKAVRHARQVIFQMAEVAVSRELFDQVLGRIRALALAPG